ncbi:MAG: hypothetical protein J7M17_01935 [Anaerolineae bacterium]|nr:hypothetical protein [Anaerolineae bacterium]
MIAHLHRDAFSEVYTYRYRLTDPGGNLLLEVTWPALGVSERPATLFFNAADGQRLAHLDWEDRGWWLSDRFQLFLEGQKNPLAVVEEHWRIVDRILLHLPRYYVNLADGNRLEVQGNRYSQRFYEIFVLPAQSELEEEETGVWLGEIIHPPAGPTYILRTESPLLTTIPLLLVAIVTIVDLWGLRRE